MWIWSIYVRLICLLSQLSLILMFLEILVWIQIIWNITNQPLGSSLLAFFFIRVFVSILLTLQHSFAAVAVAFIVAHEYDAMLEMKRLRLM